MPEVKAQATKKFSSPGAYPNQSRGGDGLPAYADGESIARADLIAWDTIAFHHVTRPEDWPVLSTIWQGVKLRPFGLFTQNPGLGVRRKFRDGPMR
jgi:primary-amine oxidase